MKLTAEDVYNMLLNDDKILTQKGRISFNLADIDIIVRQKDVVGNIMQEWLEGWLRHKNIAFAPNDNSQMPPDFYLDPGDKRHNLLEVKAFNYKANPGFDIADFHMFEREIIQKPWMLDVTYLIFGYNMSDDGIVTVKKLWKQKVWELCRPMYSGKSPNKTPWALNLQIKEGKVYKIRPGKWYGKSKTFNHFECLEDFLAAVEETVFQNSDTRADGASWKHAVSESYARFHNRPIAIPRWSEISGKYFKQ